ncbi:MAG: sigma-54 dependent transcriptional regulator [bacterium]
MQKLDIMVIDDDLSLLRVIEHHLSQTGHTVTSISDSAKALERLEQKEYAIVFTDLKMPGHSGHDILNLCRERLPDSVVIMLTGFPTIEDAVQAMKEGAFDFVQKPVEQEKLISVVQKAAEVYELRRENRRLRVLVSEHLEFGNMIGSSASIKDVYQTARQVAQSNVSVLISGETGTGKELLAKAIHNNSPRKNEPFIAVNCAAIPKELMESELFGHEKGAFTGASGKRIGRLQAAHKGTLFLDEIGDLHLELQPKLLRVLQEMEIEPVGSNATVKIDIRVITATHKNLNKMVEKNQFRDDLYFRLNVVPMELPPLRERKEDIALLFTHFQQEQIKKDNRAAIKVLPGVLKILENYSWPGNIRELQNLCQRLVALDTDNIISEDDLPGYLKANQSQEYSPVSLPSTGIDLEAWIDKVIVAALKINNGNQSKTAKFLNISRNSLLYRMNKNGLRF